MRVELWGVLEEVKEKIEENLIHEKCTTEELEDFIYHLNDIVKQINTNMRYRLIRINKTHG